VQQLSPAPQSVIPGPPGAQLGGLTVGAQLPAEHVPAPHATAPPHWPQASHVCTAAPPEHCVEPGAQTGAAAHEHAPHAQLVVHDCVPYVLHACVAFGAQGPCPEQTPGCHAPAGSHVSASRPHWPHAISWVWPGPHTPVHAPDAQVWFTHANASPHWPLASHVCIAPLPAHCVCPGEQGPMHRPDAHVSVPPHASAALH
jgi:hypothetical protein